MTPEIKFRLLERSQRRLGRLGQQAHPCQPAVQLLDSPEAASALAVDEEDVLPHPRMTWSLHDEAHRGPDATIAVRLVEVGPQDDLSLDKVEVFSLLFHAPLRGEG